MKPSDRTIAILAVLCLAGFAVGMHRFFTLRFERGDIYPPYASLRADPLGTRALHDAIALAGIPVRRHLAPLAELPDGEGRTLMVLGMAARELDGETERALRQFVIGGGRLILAFAPVRTVGHRPARYGAHRVPAHDISSWRRTWRLTFRFEDIPAAARAKAVRANAPHPLPDTIPCRTTLSFGNHDRAWNPLYLLDDHPVALVRRWGRGHAVLLADAYLLSNEALRRQRATPLLAYLVGHAREVLFEESLHGITERPGIVSLARRYRLHGLLAGLLVAAALFLWRQSCPFVPRLPPPRDARQIITGGRDSADALVSLLRRSIRPDAILPACAAQWRRSLPHAAPPLRRHRDAVDAAIAACQRSPERRRDPVQTYREITRILSRG